MSAAARHVIAVDDLREAWPALSPDERAEAFAALPAEDAEDFFVGLRPLGMAQILVRLPTARRRIWLRLLEPDDAADVLQELGAEERRELLALLDEPMRREVSALLAYEEDEAGGLMSPRYARVRPDMTVEEALRYLRRQALTRLETLYYAYVLDAGQRLLGVVSFRELFAAPGERRIDEIMVKELVSVPEDMDQEHVSRVVSRSDLVAVPVLDAEGRMKGIVTVDDIVDVVQEEATEDAQKFGGLAALETPYLQTGLGAMVRKRVAWLAVLFVGELLTASAMSRYEDELARAIVLAMFVPLIISSGGNSGSQAATLVIRAMALGEVKLKDWAVILRRELAAGLAMGLILSVLGMARVLLWEEMFGSYGRYAALIGVTVAASLVGVVLCGTLAGAMLPFLLRRLKLDPASASAPFVATLVDVSGVVIYFSVAELVLGGTLL
jgi:magnesium transporter